MLIARETLIKPERSPSAAKGELIVVVFTDGLKKLYCGWCRRSAARVFSSLDPGLTPWANCNSAAPPPQPVQNQDLLGAPATRLWVTQLALFVLPRNLFAGPDIVSEARPIGGTGLKLELSQLLIASC